MRNPFRTEAEQRLRLVWLSIIYFALIVVGAYINRWLGLGVFIGETAIVAWWVITHGRNDQQPVPQASPGHEEGEHRILVIANETVGGEELLAELKRRVDGVRAQVFVVSPALNSKLRHWVPFRRGSGPHRRRESAPGVARGHACRRNRGARPDRR